ncbi:MAG: beta-ketoacyl synthase [Flavobacterium psychrophilum]|nr:MAG: beta-ketoacyl synthase [Flavobacterium psychrophilum]
MHTPVSILSIASFSALGATPEAVWDNYRNTNTLIRDFRIGNKTVPAAALTESQQAMVAGLRDFDARYDSLDNSVLYSMLASRAAVSRVGWTEDDVFGINIGSSRGATDLFEKHHGEFLETGKTGIQASPATTLGNISSWVAQDLKSTGPEISHSITCSTALHALLNGVAWLRAGMAHKFLVGGSEAPLTPFTIAQMQAMKIYSTAGGEYPCRAFDFDKRQNTMVLGEGAVSACLMAGMFPDALAYIEGIGYATETLKHSVSISDDAECLQKSMLMALENTEIHEVDAIVMHAPGTIKGDSSEYKAIQNVFSYYKPLLTTNKWKIGHTFGASGLLSLEFAVQMLQNDTFIGVPFIAPQIQRRPLRKILVNAVGFGGNAVSVLVSR